MDNNTTKKRWISLFVENQIGCLARISGLFSSKSYNIDSITVGATDDPTVSRMTIGVTSDDMTYEQIKKQLNRSVEVIKVLDYTTIPIHMKELMFIKVNAPAEKDKTEVFRIAKVFGLKITDYDKSSILLESVDTENHNDDIIRLLSGSFPNRLEVVRGGSVAIESISITDR